MDAVIMAGGFGKRLRPLTYAIPKPLIPIGDKPILEILLGQLKRAGLERAFIATGYRSELIQSYFGDGKRFGVTIEYVEESEPLGTAGALNLIRARLTDPFLMLNGDLLTRLAFDELYRTHVERGALLTAGAASYQIDIPYGVIESNGSAIDRVVEKPTESYLILAGIYALSPAALDHMPESGPCDTPDLIRSILAAGGQVDYYKIDAFWMDVGKMDDFEVARKVVETWEDI
jgi:NDP-sugar pyrophosphorylase family protein